MQTDWNNYLSEKEENNNIDILIFVQWTNNLRLYTWICINSMMFHNFQVFFTRNGKIVGTKQVSIPKGGFFPTVGMLSSCEKVRVDLHPLTGWCPWSLAFFFVFSLRLAFTNAMIQLLSVPHIKLLKSVLPYLYIQDECY